MSCATRAQQLLRWRPCQSKVGRNVGATVPLSVGRAEGSHPAQCRLDQDLPRVASSYIQTFGHNRHGLRVRKPPKWGRLYCAPFRGDLDPHLTQCRLSLGLPPYQVASWSIQPFGHNTPDEVHIDLAESYSALRLQLNPSKTELIWFGTRCKLNKIPHEHLPLSTGLSIVPCSAVVYDLGVLLDSELHGCRGD